jgi:hypothetical protein
MKVMNRKYHEEVQALRDNPWFRVLLIALTIAAVLPIGSGLYWQIFKGQPWGNEPMSNNGLIALFLLLIVVCVVVNWLLLSRKLELKIGEDGVHYRLFPQQLKWAMISKSEIADFTIERKKFPNFRIRHAQLTKRQKIMDINGNVLLSLQLKNGQKIRLGSRNPEAVAWAMRKLFSSNEID